MNLTNSKSKNVNYISRTLSLKSQQLIGEDDSSSLKIVVRRLPPDMDLNKFLDQVSPIPKHNYLYFVKADMKYGKFAYSRAYINLTNQADLLWFKEKYDKYIFLSSKGVEYPAVVEYAPSPEVPTTVLGQNWDTTCSTIDSNIFYSKFIDSISNPEKYTDKSYEFASKKPDTECIKTPLLLFIARKKKKQKKKREKQARNRNKNKQKCQETAGTSQQ